MPRRSNELGQWTRECKLCGAPFFQRRPAQEYCSQKCSNKASPGLGGRKPADVPRRQCVVCGTEFQPYRSNVLTCSRACYRQSPAWKEVQRRTDARPERKARKNELRRVDPARAAVVRAYNRKHNLSRYGVTPEDYDRMLAEQDGKCALCGRPPTPNGVRAASKLHVDHDHETGAVRDLLCSTCNVGIGNLGDDPGLLRAAAAYIERHRAVPPS